MLFDKKFKAIEEVIESNHEITHIIIQSLKTLVNDRFEEEQKFIESVRSSLNKKLIKNVTSQVGFNKNVLEIIGNLQEENKALKKQVSALIESHPNKAMYNGSLKSMP